MLLMLSNHRGITYNNDYCPSLSYITILAISKLDNIPTNLH
jgi:hypothetical protein